MLQLEAQNNVPRTTDMAQIVPLHALVVTQWLALPKEYVKRVERVQPVHGQDKKQNVNVSNALR